MTTPGFGPNTLDESGCPIWINDLANEDPNHLVHVVRALEPGDALEMLGADRQSITSCVLPAQRPDQWTSLPRAAIQPLNPTAVLLAGRIGEWTFVYDDLGLSLYWPRFDGPPPPPETAQVLSGKGEVAATGYATITGHAGFLYAINGELLINEDPFALTDPLGDDAPAEVRAAFEQAGIVDPELDDYASMRAICALAGLPRTLQEIQQVPLLVAPLD